MCFGETALRMHQQLGQDFQIFLFNFHFKKGFGIGFKGY